MDHLPLPEGCEKHWKVPVSAKNHVYQPGDFFQLPRAYGFVDFRAPLKFGAVSCLSSEKVAEFLQSWLYFSLLSQFLNIEIDIKEFSDSGQKFLTSQSLPAYLERWTSDLTRQSKLNPISLSQDPNLNTPYYQSVLALEIARTFISEHIIDASNFPRLLHRPVVLDRHCEQISALEILGISLVILEETLEQCLQRLSGSLEIPLRSCSVDNTTVALGKLHTLSQCLLDSGLCPSRLSALAIGCRNAALYFYVLWLKNVQQDPRLHVYCTANYCKANLDVDLKPMHLEGCDGFCQRVHLSESNAEVQNWIESGLTPLVTWDDEHGLIAKPYDLNEEKIIFGALSHSWADGIVPSIRKSYGSNDRQMLLCQIRSLQQTFNSFVPASTSHQKTAVTMMPSLVPFWVDVLCMPQGRQAKAMAMDQLNNIYSKAYKVLIWDKLLILENFRASVIEVCTRVRLGGWSQRLWTLLETILAQSLAFQLSTGQTIGLNDVQRESERARTIGTHDYHYCWELASPFNHAVQNLRRQSMSRSPLLPAMWEALNGRLIDRREEETIVLAGILGLSSAKLRDPPQYKAINAFRMRIFLQMLHEHQDLGIPAEMIFLYQHGGSLPGCTWAPLSWIGGLAPPLRSDLHKNNKRTTSLTGHHFLVEFPGLALNVSGKPSPAQTYIFWDQLEVWLFENNVQSSCWYEIRLVREEDTKGDGENLLTAALVDGRLSVILDRDKLSRSWSAALLVGHIPQDNHGDTIHVERLRQCSIRLVSEDAECGRTQEQSSSQGLDIYCFARRYDSSQKWCFAGSPYMD